MKNFSFEKTNISFLYCWNSIIRIVSPLFLIKKDRLALFASLSDCLFFQQHEAFCKHSHHVERTFIGMPLTRWLGGLSVPTEIPEPLAVFPIRKMRERVPAYLVEDFFVLFFARSATFLYTVVIPSISASFPANRYCSAKISIDEIASQT